MKKDSRKSQNNNQSWSWRKAWGITLPIARTRDGERLLAEGNISFKQAVSWILSASFIYSFLITLPSLFENSATVTLQNILLLFPTSLVISLLSPIGFAFLTGLIHITSKIFRSKGVWKKFFIIYVAFTAPIMIGSGIITLINRVFSVSFFSFVDLLLVFYWLLVVGPVTVKANYQFRWLSAFLINIGVVVVIFFFIERLYNVLKLNIL